MPRRRPEKLEKMTMEEWFDQKKRIQSGYFPGEHSREMISDVFIETLSEIHNPVEISKSPKIIKDTIGFLKNYAMLNERWGYNNTLRHSKFEERTHREGLTVSQAYTDPVFRILHQIEKNKQKFETDTIQKFREQASTGIHRLPDEVYSLWWKYLNNENTQKAIKEILRAYNFDAKVSVELFTVKYALCSWLYKAMGKDIEAKQIQDQAIEILKRHYTPVESEASTPAATKRSRDSPGENSRAKRNPTRTVTVANHCRS